ncbi:MAG: hypothetical protein WBX05_12280 [Pseudolabrys sp.]
MLGREHFQKYWLFAAAGAVAIFLAAGIYIFETLPPRTIVMATGAEGGANHELGIRYRDILAQSGVKVQLLPTSGIWRACAIQGQGLALDSYKVAPPPRKNRRMLSRLALCFTSPCGFSTEVKLVTISRRYAADGYQLALKEVGREHWRSNS